MNDEKMSTTAGSYAMSAHIKKKSIEQGSNLEAATYKLTWIV